MYKKLSAWLFLGVLIGSAGCDESEGVVSALDQSGSNAPSQSEVPTFTEWSATASPGATGGSVQLAPGVAAIYAVEFADGSAVLSAAVVLRGEPGWADPVLGSNLGLSDLVHVGIGATLGSHSVMFDPISAQLWIDDNQSLPVATNNVLVFQVPPERDKPLRLSGQQHLDPALGTIPYQGYSQLVKERVRAKLLPLIKATNQ